jgi:hypothetical protein
MRSSVIPKVLVSATCLSMLNACNNFAPTTAKSIPELRNESFNALAANIIKSKAFQDSSNENQVALLEILHSALTAKSASRFQRCFSSRNFHSALASLDLVGQTLLSNLHALATEAIHPELESQRAALVTGLFEYACGLRPLDQGNSKGCGPVCCLIALGNKAEIIRLVQGLSSLHGAVRLASGAIMQRCNSSIPNNGDDELGPAIRILAAAVLNHGNGSLFGFSSRLDLNFIGPVGFPGMLSSWTKNALTDLTGEPHTLLKGPNASVESMKGALLHCKYLVVLRKATATNWHWIVVRHIDKDWVYFQDPNGTPYALPHESVLDKRKKVFVVKKSKPPKSQAEINFPEEYCNIIPLGMYRVPTAALASCTKVVIAPAAAIQFKPDDRQKLNSGNQSFQNQKN